MRIPGKRQLPWSLAALGFFFPIVLVSRAGARARNDGVVLAPYSIIHVVPDLDRSVVFYRDRVGLQVDDTSALPALPIKPLQRLLNAPSAGVATVTLAIPGSAIKLVLVQFHGIRQRRVESRLQDPGVVKLVLSVRDIDKEFSAIKPYLTGIYTTGGAPVHPEGPSQRAQAVIVRDPDGFPLEMALAALDVKTNAPVGSNIVGGWPSYMVDSLDQTIQFYSQQFDFKFGDKRPFPHNALVLEGTPSASVINAPAVAPGSNTRWFLYEFHGVDRRELNSRMTDVGAAALAFRVSNVKAMLARLEQANAPVLSEGKEPVRLGDGSTAVVIRDPSQIPIELVQQ